jgi:hypothetical protein
LIFSHFKHTLRVLQVEVGKVNVVLNSHKLTARLFIA